MMQRILQLFKRFPSTFKVVRIIMNGSVRVRCERIYGENISLVFDSHYRYA